MLPRAEDVDSEFDGDRSAGVSPGEGMLWQAAVADKVLLLMQLASLPVSIHGFQ